MLYPFHYIFDFIFPPTLHEVTLRPITRDRFVTFSQPQIKNSIVYLAPYQFPLIQSAIAACKFEQSYHAAQLLSALVEKYLQSLPPKKTLLIPIPLSAPRERERGFNQVERVLSYVDTKDVLYPVAVNTKLLKRTRHTVAQTTLSRKERLKNMTQAFTCNERTVHILKEYERIILCDDVYTTGSTFTAAQKTLTPHLPATTTLYLLAWSH